MRKLDIIWQERGTEYSYEGEVYHASDVDAELAALRARIRELEASESYLSYTLREFDEKLTTAQERIRELEEVKDIALELQKKNTMAQEQLSESNRKLEKAEAVVEASKCLSKYKTVIGIDGAPDRARCVACGAMSNTCDDIDHAVWCRVLGYENALTAYYKQDASKKGKENADIHR